MLDNIEILPISLDDYEFGYTIKEMVLKEYIEKTWGKWDNEKQKGYYSKNFKLENNYLIKYSGRKIGWLEYFEKEFLIEINQIFIHPEYQGKGIGSFIIKDIINKGINIKKPIILQVLKSNEKAIKLYQKLGFIEYEDTKTHLLLKYNI